MINILIPMAANDDFFHAKEYYYPKPLIELNGKMMIEHVIDNLNSFKFEKQFIFIVNSHDCKKHHLDNILNLLTDSSCKSLRIDNETKGAACSSLMAIEYIDNDNPLIIANADQIIDEGLPEAVSSFENSDAGAIIFESIHPRWSYVRLDEKHNIMETAEKKPISKNAIAGFYYFKKGYDFCKSAMTMIKKDASVNGSFYVAPTLNELILSNKVVTAFRIENSNYHTFYSPSKIAEYEGA